ncbi:MAG: hydrogenase iron-sulfur subunit [Chloroflexi bacterium]|nr:hydrogenase iron-sulfur subunit [Chloroflexota bacterium]
MSDVRLGVFICDCGDRIASILDVDALAREVRDLSGVAVARRLRYSCSPDGLAAIQSAIAEEGLNRVLVAGCTPRTLQPRFRAACEEAGLDGDLFELVDIREGCAWVHPPSAPPSQGGNGGGAATAKAVDLIRMGVARVALRQTREPVSTEVVPAALVIGGGLAGMTAALTLANAGLPVKLVEREATLGGMLRDVYTLYPPLPGGGRGEWRNAAEFLAEKVEAVTRHPRIEVLLESQVTGIAGTVGRYTVGVSGCGQQFDVGAIIVATGARVLQPWGQFRYDRKRVITQLEFERELTDQGRRTNRPITNVVMILCAGQRNEAIPYCSGVCCMGALTQALEVKAANPQANVTILFRDLYLPGEDIYEELLEAQRAGVEFIRYAPSSPPQVTDEAVEVHDELTGMDHHLPYDRVVLATPLVPQPDASVVAHMLAIAQDENGFFPEVRYRLRPQNYVERGIYVCGAAHYPAGRMETEFQAISTAFNALRHLQAGQVTSQAPVAVVDEKRCTGCGNCVESCPFGAISMHKREGVLDLSQIDPLLCKGCGNCVVTCPVKAISQPLDSDAQVLAQIDAALAGASPDGRPRIVVFGCEWSSHAAAELAGANKLSYPVEVRLIRVGCSARFDPIHVLWALFSGADGVFLGACPPGDCHYTNGNRYAQERINLLRGMLAESGFDPRRLRLEWITPDDPHDFVGKITDFTNLVRALGPSPARGE